MLDGLKAQDEKTLKAAGRIQSLNYDYLGVSELNKDSLYKVKHTPTCTIVSRFCLDVDTVLVWTDGLMVTTVTWWGCWVSVGAGTMTVGWWVGAGGVGGASTWRMDKM